MLRRVDRIQFAVPDRKKAATNWTSVLGAQLVSEDRISCLDARRSTFRVGNGCVEFLEADGNGRIADALASRGAHLFGAGVSTPDLDALVSHLKNQDINVSLESGQAFLSASDTGDFGLQAVISPYEELETVGALDFFYEVSLLVHDAPKRVQTCADIFGLDTTNFVPIDSDHYGYNGTLTLFEENRLDRFEIITPNKPDNTMGRYFARFGECYYMAFAESSHLADIEEKVKADGLGHTAAPHQRSHGRIADTLFLHPATLGGMMLGISRPTMAWQWSGQPDKVEAPV